MRPRGAGRGGGGFRISADPGRLGLLGSVDHRRLHGGAILEDQAADRGAARLHQSGAAGQDDLDLRPDVRRAHLHQPDRWPERERGRGRGRALRQGGALRADGGGGLDPEGAVDHPRSRAFRGQVSHPVRRAYQAAPAAAAISEVLPRRGLAAGLGNVGKAFRRASVLGRSAGTYRRQYRRDQGDGAGAWPGKDHRLRHAAAGDLS